MFFIWFVMDDFQIIEFDIGSIEVVIINFDLLIVFISFCVFFLFVIWDYVLDVIELYKVFFEVIIWIVKVGGDCWVEFLILLNGEFFDVVGLDFDIEVIIFYLVVGCGVRLFIFLFCCFVLVVDMFQIWLEFGFDF